MHIYVADRSVFTDKDIEFLKKECQELDNLLIPACEVKLLTVLGEGMYIQLIVMYLLFTIQLYLLFTIQINKFI